MTGGKQRRHLFVGKADGRHGERPRGLREVESRAMVVLFVEVLRKDPVSLTRLRGPFFKRGDQRAGLRSMIALMLGFIAFNLILCDPIPPDGLEIAFQIHRATA